ncbi:MAG: hypothetical protein JWM99_860 [Verrucomicrobiales bacterium]|nr:hypothetical protein [Verrucomicrobiales bacterium]
MVKKLMHNCKILKFTLFVLLIFAVQNLIFGAPPATPASLRASWVNGAQTVLFWDSVSEADTYTVYRYNLANEVWDIIATTNQTLIINAPELIPPFHYAVSAANSDGASESLFSDLSGGTANLRSPLMSHKNRSRL